MPDASHPSSRVRCWKCGHSHPYYRRIYRCDTCGQALCFGDLFANGKEMPIAHRSKKNLCGPMNLVGHAARSKD